MAVLGVNSNNSINSEAICNGFGQSVIVWVFALSLADVDGERERLCGLIDLKRFYGIREKLVSLWDVISGLLLLFVASDQLRDY